MKFQAGLLLSAMVGLSEAATCDRNNVVTLKSGSGESFTYDLSSVSSIVHDKLTCDFGRFKYIFNACSNARLRCNGRLASALKVVETPMMGVSLKQCEDIIALPHSIDWVPLDPNNMLSGGLLGESSTGDLCPSTLSPRRLRVTMRCGQFEAFTSCQEGPDDCMESFELTTPAACSATTVSQGGVASPFAGVSVPNVQNYNVAGVPAPQQPNAFNPYNNNNQQQQQLPNQQQQPTYSQGSSFNQQGYNAQPQPQQQQGGGYPSNYNPPNPNLPVGNQPWPQQQPNNNNMQQQQQPIMQQPIMQQQQGSNPQQPNYEQMNAAAYAYPQQQGGGYYPYNNNQQPQQQPQQQQPGPYYPQQPSPAPQQGGYPQGGGGNWAPQQQQQQPWGQNGYNNGNMNGNNVPVTTTTTPRPPSVPTGGVFVPPQAGSPGRGETWDPYEDDPYAPEPPVSASWTKRSTTTTTTKRTTTTTTTTTLSAMAARFMEDMAEWERMQRDEADKAFEDKRKQELGEKYKSSAVGVKKHSSFYHFVRLCFMGGALFVLYLIGGTFINMHFRQKVGQEAIPPLGPLAGVSSGLSGGIQVMLSELSGVYAQASGTRGGYVPSKTGYDAV